MWLLLPQGGCSSVVYAMLLCVCVHLSDTSVPSKRLNATCNKYSMIAYGSAIRPRAAGARFSKLLKKILGK